MVILQKTIFLHLVLSVLRLFDGAGFMFCCPFLLVWFAGTVSGRPSDRTFPTWTKTSGLLMIPVMLRTSSASHRPDLHLPHFLL